MSGPGLTISPALPLWGLLLLSAPILAVLVLLYRRNREGLGSRRSLLLSALRLGSIALLLVCAVNPTRTVRREHAILPPVAVLVDTSVSMGQPAAAEGRTRLDQVRSLLLDGESPLLGQLQERFRVDIYALSDAVRPLAADELARLSPGGRLVDAAQPPGPPAGRYAAAVLLSDGNFSRERTPSPAMPVFAVPVGEPAVYRDIVMAGLKAPPLAFRGREAVIDVTVRGYGYPGADLPVVLKNAGRLLKTVNIRFGTTPAEVTASLAFTPDAVGRQSLSVEIPLQAGEGLRDNNRIDFSLQVGRDKTRILMISGTPSMNYRFMRQALKSDPSIDLLSFVVLRTPSDILNVPPSEQSLIPFPVETLFTRDLAGFDLVVFDNFNYSLYLRPEYLENLQAYVRNGGGFALIGGPGLFHEGPGGLTPVTDILPVRFGPEAVYRRKLPVAVRLGRAGARHPIMRLRDDLGTGGADAQRLWQEMPPLDGINLMEAKPSSTVLLESTDGIPWPILAVTPHGQGRVLALATDYAWKWYMGMVAAERDSQPYLVLVHRMVRWLTRDPGLDDLQISLPQAGAVVGRELDVGIALRGEAAEAQPATAVAASVTDPEGIKIASQLAALPQAGEFRLSFAPEKAGVHRVAVETPAGRQEDVLVVAGAQDRLDAAPRHDALAKIAAQTGGAVATSPETLTAALEARLTGASRRFVEEKALPLWATPVMMIAVLGLLALEWFLRRRWGLP